MEGKPWIEPVSLTGSLVRLDPLTEEDLPGLWEIAQDQSIWRWFPMTIRSFDELDDAFRNILSWPAAGTGQGWVKRTVDTGEMVGGTTYLNADAHNRRVEIGFTWLNPGWQRTGVNSECKLMLMRYAFEQLGTNRVEFKTDSRNEKSRNALTGIGAKEEGIFRNHMVCPDGSLRHSAYFSVTAQEWPEVERGLIERLERHG